MTIIATDGDFIYEDRQTTFGSCTYSAPSKLIRLGDRVIMAFAGAARNAGELSFLHQIRDDLVNVQVGKPLEDIVQHMLANLKTLTRDQNDNFNHNSIMIVNPTQAIILSHKNLHYRKVISLDECRDAPHAVIGSGSTLYRTFYRNDALLAMQETIAATSSCGHGINKIDIRNLGSKEVAV